MKSIKTKMIIYMEIVIFLVLIGLSGLALQKSSSSLKNNNDKTMVAIAGESAKLVESRVKDQLNILTAISYQNYLTDDTLSKKQMIDMLSKEIKRYNYSKLGIANLKGDVYSTDGTSTNIAERDYFKKALAGEVNVSDPLVSKTTGEIVVKYAVPIKKNDKVIRVLTASRDGNEISNITNDITFGDTGKAFMINNTGVKIAHYKKDLVLNMDNDLEKVKKDSSLKEITEIEKKMIKGEKGHGTYTYGGKEKYIAYAPVKGTTWSLGVVVESSEILSELNSLKQGIIIFAIFFLVIGLVIVYFVSGRITSRIKIAIKYIETIASGDFSTPVSKNHLNLKDEIGKMLQAVDTMQHSIKGMVESVVKNSSEIDVDSQTLSSVAEEMQASSEAVSIAIEEVTKATTVQAQDLVSMIDIMNSFSKNLEQIAADIADVDKSSNGVMSMTSDSNDKIHNLAQSVKDTNTTFKSFEAKIQGLSNNINKINEITNMINSVAEQTNLLALNAAIEAARAGESGRGFAVVAEEIRKLSEQSRVSAENISKLIGTISEENELMINTTQTVSKEFSRQATVIDGTLNSFNNIVNGINSIIPKIQSISVSSLNINNQKDNIISKVEATAAISEENSAAAEEIAAATEEVNKSAQEVAKAAKNLETSTNTMMTQVNKFKI